MIVVITRTTTRTTNSKYKFLTNFKLQFLDNKFFLACTKIRTQALKLIFKEHYACPMMEKHIIYRQAWGSFH